LVVILPKIKIKIEFLSRIINGKKCSFTAEETLSGDRNSFEIIRFRRIEKNLREIKLMGAQRKIKLPEEDE
jgi:hypothetical protein